MGEPFRFIDRFSVVNACFESEYALDNLCDLDKTHLEGHAMCLCMRGLLDLVLIILYHPDPLDHSFTSPHYLLPSPSPKYYIDVPIDNPMICSATMDLSYEDNLFDVPRRNVDDNVSLGYFRWYDPPPHLPLMYTLR